MLRGLQLELDYFTCILNKQNLQAETHPCSERIIAFTSLLMQTYKTKIQRQPSVRGMGGRSFSVDTNPAVGNAGCSGTGDTAGACRGWKARQSSALAVWEHRLCLRALPWVPLLADLHRAPEPEIISTLGSLKSTWLKCEILSPHRIANLDIECCKCTDTRKEHCRMEEAH